MWVVSVMASLYCQLDMLERKKYQLQNCLFQTDLLTCLWGISLVANSCWRVLPSVGSPVPYAGQPVFYKKDS